MSRGIPRFGSLVATVLVVATGLSWAQPPGPDAEAGAQALARTLAEAGQRWFEVVSQDPDDPDLAGFAGWLRDRDDIGSAEVQEETVVATSAGIAVVFDDLPPGIAGPRPSSRQTAPVLGQAGAAAVRRTRRALLPSAWPWPAAFREPRCIGDLVPKGKALIISALGPESVDPSDDFKKILEHVGFDVQVRPGKVASFGEIASSSIVIVDSHGGLFPPQTKEHYTVQAEVFDITDAARLKLGLKEGWNWLKDRQLATNCTIERDKNTQRPLRVMARLCILDTWFEKNLPSLVNNAAILMLTCHSGELDATWRIFRSKGAAAYLGFEGKVEESWADDWGLRLLDRVTGANQWHPWDTDPPRRAQSFQQAYDYICAANPRYKQCPRTGGKAKLRTYWEGQDPTISAHPHIDCAMIRPLEQDSDYELTLYGAFGRQDECRVLLGGDPLTFESVSAGGGWPFRVKLPSDATGDLVVETQDGRKSNPVTISKFEATVNFDHDDPTCAGKIKLRYRELVVGTRLYRDTDPNMVMRYAGWPEEAGGEPFYPFVLGNAHWELEWEYNSVKPAIATTIRARGQGQARGRGSGEEELPDGFVIVKLEPAAGSRRDRFCKAKVSAAASVGPIHFVQQTPLGPQAWDQTVSATGVPEVEVQYDQEKGILSALSGNGPFCHWEMSEVRLDPPPQDFTKQARCRVPLAPEQWLPKLLGMRPLGR